jgi:thioredoxin-related protein
MKKTIFLFVILAFLVGCTAVPQVEEATPEVIEFSKCLKESGLVMYGSMTCSVCKRQKEIFGSAFEEVGEVECHPDGDNPQTELCLQKDITKTPTWILQDTQGEELERKEGYQDFEALAELTGCGAPVEN